MGYINKEIFQGIVSPIVKAIPYFNPLIQFRFFFESSVEGWIASSPATVAHNANGYLETTVPAGANRGPVASPAQYTTGVQEKVTVVMKRISGDASPTVRIRSTSTASYTTISKTSNLTDSGGNNGFVANLTDEYDTYEFTWILNAGSGTSPYVQLVNTLETVFAIDSFTITRMSD